MSEPTPKRVDWRPILDRMFEELRAGSARGEGYWAQQVAFAPVLPYAVALAVRRGEVASEDLELLRRLLPDALALLGALPDGSDGDPYRLALLARRQARALASGRRRFLVRLASRLGLEISEPPYEPVPSRLLRPYELLGWRPRPPAAGPASPPQA